jgi:hypothetical protein
MGGNSVSSSFNFIVDFRQISTFPSSSWCVGAKAPGGETTLFYSTNRRAQEMKAGTLLAI